MSLHQWGREMKNLTKTMYFFEQHTKSIDDELRASRYAYLVDEVENVRQKVFERKNSLPNLIGIHLLPHYPWYYRGI
jgi:hypothetical protein